ncbi:diaminopimelate decarboxylase [Micrococcoides hystricis]|uniref:Diaminopimelate decarboxylase n=1 Tax=Micrococcoides hystricis TaxID=1572761 RepID=A0ABV6PBS3_9MICC
MTTASPLAPEWLSVPEDLNALNPLIFPADAARDDSGELTLGGLPVRALAEKYGTALYVYSEDEVRTRAATFRSVFNRAVMRAQETSELKRLEPGGRPVDVFYAGKAFLCTKIARWVHEEGLNLDTASGGELAIALAAGVPAENIGLHGNNKSDEELRRAMTAGVGRIIADSMAELERIDRVARQLSDRGTTLYRPAVMLRLTPGVHAETHDFIATAHEDQKFGLSMAAPQDDPNGPSMAEQAAAYALSSGNMELVGVHAHIGSQIFAAEGFAEAAKKLIGFLAKIKNDYGKALPELDLGGGYGIAYTEADKPRDIAAIAEHLAENIVAACLEHGLDMPQISIEPGRAIAGPSGVTLYTVGTIKDVTVDSPVGPVSRKYVSVDGGMSDNARPVLYDADYTAVLASRASSAEPVLCRVVGKHCESGDIVVRDVYLPSDISRGDILAVPATGAYCHSLSSNYNYLTRPAVVGVKDGRSELMVRAETEDEMLQRDVGFAETRFLDQVANTKKEKSGD